MERTPEYMAKKMVRLSKLWDCYPDQALGRLLMNLAAETGAEDCFYVEDDLLLGERFPTPIPHSERRRTLELVATIWAKHPSLRLGQLLMVLASTLGEADCFPLKDEELAGCAESLCTPV